MMALFGLRKCSVHVDSLFSVLTGSQLFVLDMVCLSHDSILVSVKLTLCVIHLGIHVCYRIIFVVI